MRRLLGGHARRSNRERGLTGHVFQGRFGAEPIVDEPHLLEVVRYVVLNPVRAGICAHPREWAWSSYTAYLDPSTRPPFLTTDLALDLFGGSRRELAAFVDDGLSAYPKPYVPGKRSASSRTSSATGSPTTFR